MRIKKRAIEEEEEGEVRRGERRVEREEESWMRAIGEGERVERREMLLLL